jgi:type I restriction enzyme S subunit
MGKWITKSLDEIVDVLTDFVANGSFESLRNNVKYLENGYAILLRTYDLNNNLKEDFIYIDEKAYGFLSKSKLFEGDIVISNVGAVGSVFHVPNLNYPMSLAPNALLLRTNQCNDFFYQLLLSNVGQKNIKCITSTTAQPKFNKTDFRTILFNFPENIKEQEKIAEILSEMDKVIDSTEKMIAKYTLVKEGMLQDLLTNGIDENGNIRSETTHQYKDSPLGRIPVEWDCVNVGATLLLKARIGWQGLKAYEFIDEGACVVTGTDFIDGKVNWNTCYHVSMCRYNQDKNIQLKENDLLITKDGSVGKVAKVDSCPQYTTLNSGVFVIRPKFTNIENEYIYYLLRSLQFSKFMENVLTGSTIKHLNQEKFVQFTYKLPKNDEQKNIIGILKISDYKISEEQKHLEKLKLIKQALMQDLLNNRVSVDCLL